MYKSDFYIFCLYGFLMVYLTIGDPNNSYWSGGFFITIFLLLTIVANYRINKLSKLFINVYSAIFIIRIITKFILNLQLDGFYMPLFVLVFIAYLIMIFKKNKN